jgi:hypothetical protein
MSVHAVLTDTTGTAYVTAEYRRELLPLCARLRMDRSAIRWSTDLRCFVLAVRAEADKQTIRKFLNQYGKGGVQRVQNSMRLRQ